MTANSQVEQRNERSDGLGRWTAAATIIGFFVLWELVVRLLRVPEYLLPPPSIILKTIWTQHGTLATNAWRTLWESIAGFGLGNLVAILLAIAIVENRTAERTIYPMAVALRTVPIIALVPILTLVMGNGWEPKVVIAALITFFPTLVDMIKGLMSPDPELFELCHVLDASRWYVFWRIRLPASLPYLFAALKIAATSCVLGAIVAEWIGSQVGIGYLIVLGAYQYRGDLLFAAIFVASAMALVLFWLVAFAEKRLIRWEPESEIGA